MPLVYRLSAVVYLSLVYCLSAIAYAADRPPAHTVFWISVDGLRPDYLDRADTPFFDRLRAGGAFSDAIKPVFPSVTFTTHVSKATGVKPEEHGILGNAFYDNRDESFHRYPGDSALLEAEPIWITAARQGIRTAVLDWPLAHNQQGSVTTAYFGPHYERGISDEQRLNRLLDLWENDDHPEPLQFILGYIVSPDSAGHRHGPDAPETIAAVERADRILASAFARAETIWQKQNPAPDDRLFLILSSDHGMSRVHTLVHPGHLTGLEGRENVLIMTTANVAHIHLNRIRTPRERNRIINQTLARLSEFDYVSAYRREEIPERWGLRHPHRTGDLLLVLDTGHTFSRRPSGIEQSPEESGGPLGMHGYDPDENPEMLTPLFIYSHPEPTAPHDLGPADALQLHATISEILGITPAPAARPDPIPTWQATPAL